VLPQGPDTGKQCCRRGAAAKDSRQTLTAKKSAPPEGECVNLAPGRRSAERMRHPLPGRPGTQPEGIRTVIAIDIPGCQSLGLPM